jgi:Na+-transporting NADH:ubiquinone oxidoreductase subunit NqrF
MLYRTEMEELAKNIPDFEYDIALSRQPDWTGYQGYVHQIYQEKYANTRPDIKFMICGWSKMIDDAVAHLIVDMGYERGQVVYELYG